MPTLYRLAGEKVRICMYPDHAPPHFHLGGPSWSAQIDLRTLEVMRGDPPAKHLREARKLAADNLEWLWQKWEELNERDG
jgi:hypothetical protein